MTKASFIRKQLLFAEGEPLDPEILYETERALRRLGIFRGVAVKSEGGHVTVETQDAWTLLPRLSFSSRGGVVTYDFGLTDANFLGTGRQFGVRWAREADRISKSIYFQDPQFLRPYTFLTVRLEDLTDGEATVFGLDRPFYELRTKYAARALYSRTSKETTLYGGGDTVAKWRTSDKEALLEGGLALSSDSSRAYRAYAFAHFVDTVLEPGSYGPPPPPGAPRRFFFVGLGLEREGRRWIKVRQADRLDRDEDFNLAPSFRLDAAFSPAVWDAENATRVRFSGAVGTLVPGGFARITSTFSTRLRSGFENAVVNVDARVYHVRPHVTLVGRLGAVLGYRLDAEKQVEMDGATGLRGYRLHAASGTKRVVANLEARFFFLSDILKLFSLGGVAFADEGFLKGPPDDEHFTDVGLGLRIGLARASTSTVIRMDLARALRPDPQGRKGWLLSFSSGQAF